MAIFDPKSRYVLNAELYEVQDSRGRTVMALSVPTPPTQVLLGEHLRREGQRLDHLANYYLQDPNGYWRLAEFNDVMLPDALAEVNTLRIPTVL
ncbi:hypothetical protein [Lyngbya confervoides]|uniref:LysM domain-containing protein n=1 Tax=Lyngbya confervoides BDU141951 TaxID=1574623 RepID=A0ABD4T3E7_9CYAN|nr:hypothetical protein [Lyngbya confervoides]MCM1983267.1 hypothetical protein [Lyngbya confervoides BDU141951]